MAETDDSLRWGDKQVENFPDLIVWPEASLPVILEEEPVFFEQVKNLAKEIRTPLLIGAVTEKNGLYYNSALLVSGDGNLLTTLLTVCGLLSAAKLGKPISTSY